jgi:general secretion pathway protein A
MYERFFGLVDAPFRLTPDPRYLFLSRKHADALAHLKLGLAEASGFVCITGDVGAGKTTLLRSFLAKLGPDVSTAYVFNPFLSPLELLQTINTEFKLPAASESRKTLTDALNTHLLALREAGRRAVVVIDEAQALPIEVLEQLRLLSNLETTTEKLLHLVLVGQPQLRKLLQHPELVQLNQRITLRWHIGPLTPTETAAYVRHRLAIASRGKAGRLFTGRALSAIHRRANGVPRLVNMISHRAMVAAFANDKHLVTPRFVRQAYREISTVPLPEPVPRRRLAWTTIAAVGALAAVALGAIAAVRLVPRSEPGEARDDHAAVAPAEQPGEPADTAPVPPAVADSGELFGPPAPAETAPEPDTAPPPPVAADPAPDPAPPVDTLASAPKTDETAPPPPAAEPVADVEGRLAALGRAASARAALDGIFAAWQARPLTESEPNDPASFPEVAARRALQVLVISTNGTLLRALDLPAILEVSPDGTERYVTAVGLTERSAILMVDGVPTPIARDRLDRAWRGRAHVFWRDFDAIGPTVLGPPSSGPAVQRLQALLRRAGVYGGSETGIFDFATKAAVLNFQRERYIHADGLAGPLTRILLYEAAGGYARPTLASETGATS